MKRLFSRADLRDVSLVLAFVILLASVPSTAGLVIVSGPSQPEWTINICQPIQIFDRLSITLFARPANVLPEFVLRDLGSSPTEDTVRLVDCKVAPDTPPPKSAI